MNNAILECPTNQYCIGERRSIRKQTEEALLLSSADEKINNFITKPRYIKCKEWTEENDDDIVKGDLYLFRGYIGKRSGKYVEKNQIFQRMEETDVLTKIQFDDLDKNLGLHVVILPSQNGIMSRYIPPAPSTSSSLSSETNELNIKMENKNVKKKHTKLLKKRKKRDKDIVVVRRRSNRKSIPVIEVNVKNISEYRKCKIWPNSSIEEGGKNINNFITKPRYIKCKEWTEENDDDIVKGDLYLFRGYIGKRSGKYVEKNQIFQRMEETDVLTKIQFDDLDKNLGLHVVILPSQNGIMSRYIPPVPSTSSSLSSETNELNIKLENKNVKKKHTKLLKKRKKRDKDIVVVRRRSNRKSIPVIEVNVKNISEYRKCKIWPNSSIEEGDLYLYTKPNKEKQIFHRIKRSGVHHFTGFDMVDELTTIAYEDLDKKLGLYIKFLANGVAAPLTKTAHLPKSNPKKLSGKHANEKSDNKSASKRIVTKQKKQKVVIEKKQKIKKQLIQLVDKKSSTETSLSNSIPKITTVHSNKSQTNAKSVTLNSINKPMQEFPNIPNDDNNNNNKPCNGSENEKIDCIDSSKSNSNSNSNTTTSVRNVTRLSEKLAGGGGITCTFNEGSVLGFGLIEATDEHDNICIRILKIMPNTQAARYSAVLNEKCVIEQIGNDIIFNQSFNNVINLLRTAPRPLKIVFNKVPNLTDVES